VQAFDKPESSIAPVLDFDIRGDRATALPSKDMQEVRTLAVGSEIPNEILSLQSRVKNLKIRWSALTGAPSRIYSTTDTLTEASEAPAKDIAISFLTQNLTIFLLSPEDMSEIRFSRDFVTKHNGVTHLTIQQQVNGIDVFGGTLNINIDKEGRILNVSGELMPGIHESVNADAPLFSEQGAVETAAKSANLTNVGETRVKGSVYFPLNKSEARLAWDVVVEDADTPNVYHTLVDAVDGTVLWRQNLTQYQHGLVYTSDSPDPDTPTGTSNCTPPSAIYPDCTVPRVDANFNGGEFFPVGNDHRDWWNDSTGSSDTTTTKSNNVHAKEDSDGDNDDTEGFPTVSGSDFTFAIDLTEEPTVEDASVQNRSAAIVNAFYWINRIHDIYYSLGFDEASGNFQSDNFGLGGTGGDPVQADVQDPAKNCNAGFSTPTDGNAPRMTLYLCNWATPERDAALEDLIIIHEYTHGLVKRLVDVGPYSSQSGGLQDGTCDFMGIAITSEPDDDLTLSYPRGQWYYNNVAGNRRQPYSTNQTVFTRTYANISDNPDPWPAGEIWCNTMWIARANLVWKHDFDVGRNTILQLVVDGLKDAPSRPDYLDMRDSILLADNTNNGGVNQCILWDAFAKMGMGDSASSTGDTDNSPTEAFDIPTECEPDIEISTNLDFGNVCLGESVERLLPVNNNDDSGDLIISSISNISGSPDITVEPIPHPVFVEPHGSADFSVNCTPTECGVKTATIRVESNDPDQPQMDLVVTCAGDTLEPELLCPDDITIECTESTDPSHTGNATSSDTCSDPTMSYSDTEISGSCPAEKVITRTWTSTDGCDNSNNCDQTITVVDTTPPVIDCDAPSTITPPDAPISFRATATDNCEEVLSVEITGYDCFKFTKKGKRVDKTESCVIELDGDTITILDSGGVGDNITWTVIATDSCGNSSERTCALEVSNPGTP
jgi:hypothetical protein